MGYLIFINISKPVFYQKEAENSLIHEGSPLCIRMSHHFSCPLGQCQKRPSPESGLSLSPQSDDKGSPSPFTPLWCHQRPGGNLDFYLHLAVRRWHDPSSGQSSVKRSQIRIETLNKLQSHNIIPKMSCLKSLIIPRTRNSSA